MTVTGKVRKVDLRECAIQLFTVTAATGTNC